MDGHKICQASLEYNLDGIIQNAKKFLTIDLMGVITVVNILQMNYIIMMCILPMNTLVMSALDFK